MAQQKMTESGACMGVHAGSYAGMVPGAAASAYSGDIGAGRVVLLVGKASLGGAGYYPLAVGRFQDLPEDLRRLLAGGDLRAAYGGHEVVVLAPVGGEGAAVRYLLVHAGHPDVPEGLRRQLAGEVSFTSDRASYFAMGYNSEGARDYSTLRILQLKEGEHGRVAYLLDATPIPQVRENMDGLFETKTTFPAWVDVSGDLCFDAAAFTREPGAPFSCEKQLRKNNGAAALGLGGLGPNGLVFASEDAVSFIDKRLGNDEHAALYSDGGRTSRFAVQVVVDAAAGAKAGDLSALRAKAPDAGHERGGGLSAVVAILAASSAVTAVAAAAVSPSVALGSFLVLLGGVSLAMASVRAP